MDGCIPIHTRGFKSFGYVAAYFSTELAVIPSAESIANVSLINYQP